MRFERDASRQFLPVDPVAPALRPSAFLLILIVSLILIRRSSGHACPASFREIGAISIECPLPSPIKYRQSKIKNVFMLSVPTRFNQSGRLLTVTNGKTIFHPAPFVKFQFKDRGALLRVIPAPRSLKS